VSPTSIAALLERFEYELQTADGRTIRVCRDANGNLWVIDDVERVEPLREFASDCGPAARQLCERERAQAMRELAAWVKQAILRAARTFRSNAPPAYAKAIRQN
jgi:hypothetical protein